MRARLLLAVTLVVSSPLVVVMGCAAVIGVKDLIPGDPDASAGNDAEASSSPTTDGSITDAVANNNNDADASDAEADGGCGDVTGSADHCGRCNHSCLGGKCIASVCQPTILAMGQGTVSGIVLDSTNVYFTSLSNNVVARVSKGGGNVSVLAKAPDVDLAKRLAVNATHVYWGNADLGSGAVLRCPIAGCVGSGTAEKLDDVEEPVGIALDATYVYWADRNGSKIERKPIAGGTRELVAVTQGAVPVAVTVGVNDGLAFWIGDFSGEVARGFNPPDGGSISIGANGQSGRDLSLDATFVYWGAAVDPGNPGKISRAPRDGTGPSQLVGPANGEPRSVVVDQEHAIVYWTAAADPSDGGFGGGVYACDVTGCAATPRVIASGQDSPRGIAVDDTAIYFGVNGFVMKVAKP